MIRVVFTLFLTFLIHSQDSIKDQLSFLEALDPDIQAQILSDGGNRGFSEDPLLIEKSLYSKSNNEKSQENINSKFGFAFFETYSLSNTPTLDVPLSGNYKLSYGDRIRVVLNGTLKGVYELNIGLDGTILLPDIGSINLNSLTLEESNKRINERIKSVSIGTTGGIEVIRASLRKVSVLGSVNNPGIYLVNPFISIFELIQQASGLKENASLRTIKLIKSDGSVEEIDLYDYLIFGNRSAELSIENGDTVLVNPTDKFLKIHGNVFRPMHYEYIAGDNMDKLLSFAQGAKPYSLINKITLNYVDDATIKTAVNPKNLEKFSDILELYVPSSIIVSRKDILVQGTAVSNGSYNKEKYELLSELVNDLTFSEDIYPFFAYLTQRDAKSFSKTLFSFSIFDQSSYKNFKLKDDVEIFFLSKNEIEEIQKLSDLLSDDNQALVENIKELRERKQFLMNSTGLLDEISSPNDPSMISSSREEAIADNFDQKIITNNETKKFIKNAVSELDDEIFALESRFYKGFIETNSYIKDIKEYEFLYNNSLIVSIDDEKYFLPLVGKFIPKNILGFIGFDENKFNDSKVSYISRDKSAVDFKKDSITEFTLGSALSLSSGKTGIVKVTLEGQFKNPGTYLVLEGTTLNEAYQIAGGFLDTANFNGIVLSRKSLIEKEKIAVKNSRNLLLESIVTQGANSTSNVLLGSTSADVLQLKAYLDMADEIEYFGRISGDLYPESDYSKELVLENEDRIYIMPRSNTVTVLGEVLSMNTVVYEDSFSLEDYIDQAGGYSQNANKKNVYVIKANGTIVSMSEIRFRRAYSISSGDTIVVPRDMNKLQPLPLVSIASRVISDIAFAAASLNAISN